MVSSSTSSSLKVGETGQPLALAQGLELRDDLGDDRVELGAPARGDGELAALVVAVAANLVVGGILLFLAILFYVITIARM